MRTYKEIKEYFKGIGVEVDPNLKKEIAARMILGNIKIAPLIRLSVHGTVNGELHEYSQFVSVRDHSVNELVGIFTQAENTLSAKYGGPCELRLDDFINSLEDMELGGEFDNEEWLREHVGKGLPEAEPKRKAGGSQKKTGTKKTSSKKTSSKGSSSVPDVSEKLCPRCGHPMKRGFNFCIDSYQCTNCEYNEKYIESTPSKSE